MMNVAFLGRALHTPRPIFFSVLRILVAIEQITVADSRRLKFTRISESPDGPDVKAAFIKGVREGLKSKPKTLPFPFFYDETGSALFDQICKLPEYYLTRTEDEILRKHASGMVDAWETDQAVTLVELGSGSAEKTRRLIEAGIERYGRLTYVPIDVSESAVEASSRELLKAYPALRINAFVGDYQSCLADISKRYLGPKLVVFLGSSLGNYDLESASLLLRKLSFLMNSDDRLLLGLDLVKDVRQLEAAYDDAQGVTARFNKNILSRINRELQGNFVLNDFEHQARYNRELDRVEMHLESRRDQLVQVLAADLEVDFKAGETIHTESSHKYTKEGLSVLAEATGFEERDAWTDPQAWFRVQTWQVSGTTA